MMTLHLICSKDGIVYPRLVHLNDYIHILYSTSQTGLMKLNTQSIEQGKEEIRYIKTFIKLN